MADNRQIKTKFQRIAEANDSRYRELIANAKKIERADQARIKSLSNGGDTDEDPGQTNEPGYNEPIGAPNSAPAPQAGQAQPNRGGLISKTTSAVGGAVVDKVKDKAKAAVAKTLLKTALKLIPGLGEFAIAGDIIAKYWKPLLAAVVGLLLIVISLIVLIVGIAMGTPATAGTSATEPIALTAEIEVSALKKVLSGNPIAPDLAAEILASTKQLRVELAGTPEYLAILDKIDAAAAKIVADSGNQKLVDEQTLIIIAEIKKLGPLINPGSCAGVTPCLDVDGIAQSAPRLCQTTSALMALSYVNFGQGSRYFNESEYVMIKNGIKQTKTAGCFSERTMNKLSPPDRQGWVGVSWHKAGDASASDTARKDTLLEYVKTSLRNNDPVIMVFGAGGVGGKDHVVLVVGYDESDDTAKGGTYIINNPYVGGYQLKTKYGFGKRKLTGDRFKEHMAGAASPSKTFSEANPFHFSAIVRKKYVSNYAF